MLREQRTEIALENGISLGTVYSGSLGEMYSESVSDVIGNIVKKIKEIVAAIVEKVTGFFKKSKKVTKDNMNPNVKIDKSAWSKCKTLIKKLCNMAKYGKDKILKLMKDHKWEVAIGGAIMAAIAGVVVLAKRDVKNNIKRKATVNKMRNDLNKELEKDNIIDQYLIKKQKDYALLEKDCEAEIRKLEETAKSIEDDIKKDDIRYNVKCMRNSLRAYGDAKSHTQSMQLRHELDMKRKSEAQYDKIAKVEENYVGEKGLIYYYQKLVGLINKVVGALIGMVNKLTKHSSEEE